MQSKDVPELDPRLANRFLAHQLTDAECVAFEAELLRNPALAAELEQVARLKVGLQKLRATGELSELLRPPPRSYRPVLSVAAAALIVGVVIFLSRLGGGPPVLVAAVEQLADTQGRTPQLSRTYALLRTRGPDMQVIELPAARQAIRFQVLPPNAAQPPFRVSLASDEGDNKVVGTTTASLDSEGAVTVYADSTQLRPGSYVLTLASGSGVAIIEQRHRVEVRQHKVDGR